jgi:TonB-dependent receptor
VTGVREAQEQAAAEKRDALNVTETLRANDVGKLPDQNVAEAIKRLPGLSVANDQGEGRYAIVRGIDPGLLNVTLNGQTLPAPEPDGRQVKLDDLPSAMIQAVTVTKSVLPNQDANAIAGEVAIRTRTAFDSKAPFTSTRAARSGATPEPQDRLGSRWHRGRPLWRRRAVRRGGFGQLFQAQHRERELPGFEQLGQWPARWQRHPRLQPDAHPAGRGRQFRLASLGHGQDLPAHEL